MNLGEYIYIERTCLLCSGRGQWPEPDEAAWDHVLHRYVPTIRLVKCPRCKGGMLRPDEILRLTEKGRQEVEIRG